MNVKLSSFFFILMLTLLKSRKTSKFTKKRTSSRKLAVLAIFEELALKIKINENQFTIILFRKESKSEIKIEKFLFSNLTFDDL